MNTHAEKKQGTQSHSIVDSPAQLYGHDSLSAFADNRPEAVAQRKLQELANNSPQVTQASPLKDMAASYSTRQKASLYRPSPVVQRAVKIDSDTYASHKRGGYGVKELITLVKNNAGTARLVRDWKKKLKAYAKDPAISPRPFTDVNDLITHLTQSGKKTASDKNKEQDIRIQGMNTSYGADELKRGKILSYESQKAYGRFTNQIETMPVFTNTTNDLKGQAPGPRSPANDFTRTNNPFINLHALNKAGDDLQRLDFRAQNNVEIDTHGYDSRNDRTVDASTVGTSFGLGTVQIGPNISSYQKEMASAAAPNPDQLSYLNALEMQRFPHLSPQTAMKRELYNRGKFTKDEGMGFNHDHSSVEFVGAISGTSMTNAQRENMRKQQTLSNYAILTRANNICPTTLLGNALANHKHVPTSKEEMDALTNFVTVVENGSSTTREKDDAKKALRKVLTQVLRGVTQIQDVDSEDEAKYPTSPYNPGNYI